MLYRYMAVSHQLRSHWRNEEQVAVENCLLCGALVLVSEWIHVIMVP